MVTALLLPLALGCASPGPPRPPSLYLPAVVSDLTAQRIGDTVQLGWTTPSRTTDDLDVPHALTAEICRESSPASALPARQSTKNCISFKRLAVSPGPSQTIDPLPPSLTHDPVALLSYRIQIFNSNGRSAGHSPEAFTLSGEAPPPVARLRATLIRSGVQFEWQPQPSPAPVRLDRLLVAAPAPRPTPKDASRTKQQMNLAQSSPAEARLQAPAQVSDPGGIIDRTAQRDQTYRYTAQRVRTVALAGHRLELRSLSSPAVTVVMRDTFPPVPPAGLAAIPSGDNPANPSGNLPGNLSSNLSIDLSWEPVPDTDVAGYIVYRQDVDATGTPTGSFTRLTVTPVVGPAFSDRSVLPGHSYIYRVTAIDNTGNESAPSAHIRETLREP
ncbi:MAG: hypothetical protein ABI072_05620 [Edaphobacter sp.]